MGLEPPLAARPAARTARARCSGIIWVDNPADRLLPSAERLQALRIFANDAAAALVSGRHLGELRFLADHDPLTRLLNRRAFVDRLEGEVARAVRYGRSFGLVVCDLDGFKQLNDRYGHAAGDEALVAFASVLAAVAAEAGRRLPHRRRRVRGAARRGDRGRRAPGRRARRGAARAAADGGEPWAADLGAASAVASCPEDASDAQTLFRLADEALYDAKRNGTVLRFVARA